LLVLQRYIPNFPPDATDEDRFYGEPDWKTIRRKAFQDTERRLRNANLPPEKQNVLPLSENVVVFKTMPDKDVYPSPLTVK
jgi:hypothetical protein